MADKTLSCKDCNSEFIFTEGEVPSIGKKDLRTSPRDAQIAEGQEKWKETIVIEVSAAEIVGNQKEEHMLFFYCLGTGTDTLFRLGVSSRGRIRPLYVTA